MSDRIDVIRQDHDARHVLSGAREACDTCHLLDVVDSLQAQRDALVAEHRDAA